MADSFSSLLNQRFQQTGGNSNTWGDLLNTDALQVLENAVAGTDAHAVTGGASDLSVAGAMPGQMQKFTGVLSSDQTVTIANLSRRFRVNNATTGAFSLYVKTASGTAVQIPQGTIKDLYCDGANVIYRGDRIDVGETKFFANSAVPSGFLECDGSSLLRASYPDLFTAIGTTWGTADGAHFTLPDLKTAGRFIRSRSGSVALGTAQSSQNLAHTHPGSTTSTTITSLTIAADGANHTHTYSGTTSTVSANHTHTVPFAATGQTASISGSNTNQSFVNANLTTTSSNESADHTHNYSGTTATGSANHSHAGSTGTATSTPTIASDGGTEARPVNVSMLACIRY